MPEKFRRGAGLHADREIEVDRDPKRPKPTDRGLKLPDARLQLAASGP